jgi:hypothetical protein
MASLSQTVEFSIDSIAPAPPEIGMIENGRYLETDLILLNHAEWVDPIGSPVRLRYVFDTDTDPLDPTATEVSKQVGGVQIGFPSAIVSAGVQTLQVRAIDGAGNYELPCAIKQFTFLKIESAENLSADGTNSAKIGDIPSIQISGFTFDASDIVKLYDFDGTEVPYFASPIIGPESITVTFDLRIVNGVPDIDSGMGYIRVTTTSPNVTSTTTEFNILAP